MDRQGTRLDLGEQGGGFADDVTVELVVLLPVDDDPHALSLALVDLVILLGATGDEPGCEFDPVSESAGGRRCRDRGDRHLGSRPGSK
jgi:hypothetical protein